MYRSAHGATSYPAQFTTHPRSTWLSEESPFNPLIPSKPRSRSTSHTAEGHSTTAAKATARKSSVRQVHSDMRFPRRKKPGHGGAPVLEPTSTDKLIAGIWRQVYYPVQLSRILSPIEPGVDIRTGASSEVFRAVNILCLQYSNQSQSSRALKMIVQPY
ncbi:hypothetical protein M752DRAFT_301973 [Aspergillus phoenicis ATCC 13157]|uniref:Uncharacterized protein n=1 Tax=Aspergillus phoenicis ATCC 13157 TaxID=1353007 RepID=A0A370PHB3_ASPPH|nr:hypothetical protein M752DRAFT_301973 [Aspergillus phoenicis ATCC 13157]